MVRTLMFDTNVYDLIVARRGFTERLARLVEAGRIDIVRMHVQEDEIGRIPDAAKRRAMQKVPGRKVPASETAWAAPGRAGLRFIPSEDDLIAATAAAEADVLVTEDRMLRQRAATLGIEAWSFEQFAHFADALPD